LDSSTASDIDLTRVLTYGDVVVAAHVQGDIAGGRDDWPAKWLCFAQDLDYLRYACRSEAPHRSGDLALEILARMRSLSLTGDLCRSL
jgi:hypothetical protein